MSLLEILDLMQKTYTMYLILLSRARTSEPERIPNEPGLYGIFTREGRLIYIGSSGDLSKRLTTHWIGPSEKSAFRRNIARRELKLNDITNIPDEEEKNISLWIRANCEISYICKHDFEELEKEENRKVFEALLIYLTKPLYQK